MIEALFLSCALALPFESASNNVRIFKEFTATMPQYEFILKESKHFPPYKRRWKKLPITWFGLDIYVRKFKGSA